jgi:hypothetical protein
LLQIAPTVEGFEKSGLLLRFSKWRYAVGGAIFKAVEWFALPGIHVILGE